MGFLDKLKNAFFEEEEVEETSTKLAKKIEIPKKKEKEPLVTKEIIKETTNPDSKVIKKEEPLIEEPQQETLEINNKIPMMFEEEDFFVDGGEKNTPTREEKTERKDLYPTKKETSYIESVTKTPSYTYTNTRYESKETKNFRPSPIISPIYGILDKNYKKEEVVTKKEIKVTSGNYNKVDLDSIRNKAFGSEKTRNNDSKTKTISKKEGKSIYDVNSSKPSVDSVTLADADEYYNDLGLAYNVDYNDGSRAVGETRTKRYHDDAGEDKQNNNDNLFDLIESMYDKED